MSDNKDQTQAQVIPFDTKVKKSSKTNLKVVSDRLSESYASVLKATREQMGFSQQYVADSLYIDKKVIGFLEDNALDSLPCDTYTKGYIKSYAALLGLNPEGLVKDFSQAKELAELRERDRRRLEEQEQRAIQEEHDPAFDKSINELTQKIKALKAKYRFYFMFFGLMTFLSFLIAMSAWNDSEISQETVIDQVKVLSASGEIVVSDLKEKTTTTPIIPNETNEVNKVLSEVLGKKLTIVFSGRSWVTLRSAKGQILHQSRKQASETFDYHFDSDVFLKLSDASVVDVFVDGKQLDITDSISEDKQLHNLSIEFSP